ncbi:aminotransferase class V-fold PLP-dependent enzyme [Peptostreptococcus russellii]|uniref:aminotransferase class V-fold PLP-dependent enzyme n=1 Tax=Peptostreptococcus russellii TaxID=215200 RepID=UPI0016284B48|nr:aminotransferase class V-fold PLP-dependent enzyme [Peptostreptococcus russellii]MBC2576951.1 aminotransferase class V-fold PLP-dependent enzyme [Peptostreptococcus russellii]
MIYLDNAATTFPKPESVYAKMDDCMRNYCANPGRSGHKMAMESARVVEETRDIIAKLFNIKNPMDVVYTFNATDSLNLAIKGFLKPGDHVITTTMEHNSVLRPIMELENIGVEHTFVQADEEGRVDPEDVEAAIKDNTKLIAIIHASNVTGTLIDIETIGKIAKNHGITYLVDASQSAGIYDIDVDKLNIDMLAMPGHKGLLGPQGTGVLYVNNKIRLHSQREGGTGSKSEEIIQPDLYPDKYESGTHNTPGIVGLGAGVEFLLETGLDNIRKHEEELSQYMIDEILKIDGVKLYGPKSAKERAAVIAVNIKDLDSGEVTFRLDREFGIATRSGIHCAPLAHKSIGTLKQGAVRFSLGYFTTKEEVEEAIKALKVIASEA